ncbi:MAG: histone deacetylase [Acidobacteriaceae bacterium]|nr:histone deacetylase [Acidobacteriaceae bacterium]
MRLYYCDHYDMGLPPDHRFPARKYRLLREALTGDRRFALHPAPLASREEVCRAHDPEYVRQFLAGELPPAAVRRIGFPWSPALVVRTLASVGGALAATEAAQESGCGGALMGGTHHAYRAEGSGFCVFNDIAVSIADLRRRGWGSRVAVVDLDVHQGDGTAALFAEDPDVLTLSFHGRNNFPFRKQTSTIDVDFADGTGDEEYLAALDEYLPRVWEFRPDFVFYQSGVDGLREDKLGKLALTHAGLAERDRRVMTAAHGYGKPFVLLLGGGYAEPIEATVRANANTYRTAGAVWGGPGDD